MADLVVNASTARVQPVATVAMQASFDFDFLVEAAADLRVFWTDASAGLTTELTLTTEFTISGLGVFNGGSVTLVDPSAIEIGDTLTIYRDIEIKRLSEFQLNGEFPSGTINAELRKVFEILQEFRRDINRSITLAPEDTASEFTIPVDRKGKILHFDEATGEPLATISAGPLADVSQAVIDAEAAAVAAAASAAVAATFNPADYLAKAGNLSGMASTQTALGNLLAGGAPRTINAADTLVAGDIGRLIVLTGTTYTLAIDPVANLSAGWSVEPVNNASGNVIVDPNGGELINGVATFVIPPGFNAKIWRDGAGFGAKLWPKGLVDSAYDFYDTYNNSVTTVIPKDDTIPQSSEGTQIMTATITPKSASNLLLVRYTCNMAINSSGDAIMALFRDSGADAIDAKSHRVSTAQLEVASSEILVSAGSTAATTFKVNVGPGAAGTLVLNGISSGRLLGGVQRCSLVIEEIGS